METVVPLHAWLNMDIHVGMVVSQQEMCALKHVAMVSISEIINVMMVIL